MRNATDSLMRLQQYYKTLGLTENQIKHVLTKTCIRDVNLIQRKICDYQNILHTDIKTVIEMFIYQPTILNYDTISNSPTAVKSKIRDYQSILQLKETDIIKMVIAQPQLLNLDTINDGSTSVKDKIKDFKTVLQTDIHNIAKILCDSPNLLGCEIKGNSPDSIASKVQFYLQTLGIDHQTFLQAVLKSSQLLHFDVTGKEPTSVKTKIQKISEIMSIEQLREIFVYNPKILTVPAQHFKIRFILANNIGVMHYFLSGCCVTSEQKVWARYRYLTRVRPGLNLKNVYVGEERFKKYFNISSNDLMKMYPFGLNEVEQNLREYENKTGMKLRLDEQELQVLGLCTETIKGL